MLVTPSISSFKNTICQLLKDKYVVYPKLCVLLKIRFASHKRIMCIVERLIVRFRSTEQSFVYQSTINSDLVVGAMRLPHIGHKTNPEFKSSISIYGLPRFRIGWLPVHFGGSLWPPHLATKDPPK